MVKRRISRVRDLRHVAAAVSSLRGISHEEKVDSMCRVVGVADAPATDSRTYINPCAVQPTDRGGRRFVTWVVGGGDEGAPGGSRCAGVLESPAVFAHLRLTLVLLTL